MISSLSPHLPFFWLVFASLIAGVMNAMAGGGSFISFPAMLAVGVLPVQANATNTVALWPGQVTSLWALRTDIRRDLLLAVSLSSVAGGLAGALVLLNTRQVTFMRLVPWLLLLASLIFGVSGPVSRWLRRRSAEPHVHRTPAVLPLFAALFPLCFYIGYFGAGGGFLVMSALALFGVEDMRSLNALKVTAACLSNLTAIITFVVRGAIVWKFCLVSMVLAAIGGYAGAHFARRMNPGVLRAVVVVTGCVVAAYFFWRQA